MDCLYCNTAAVKHLNVPTVLGSVSDLCDVCFRKYGRRQKHFEFNRSNETNPGRWMPITTTTYRKGSNHDES